MFKFNHRFAQFNMIHPARIYHHLPSLTLPQQWPFWGHQKIFGHRYLGWHPQNPRKSKKLKKKRIHLARGKPAMRRPMSLQVKEEFSNLPWVQGCSTSFEPYSSLPNHPSMWLLAFPSLKIINSSSTVLDMDRESWLSSHVSQSIQAWGSHLPLFLFFFPCHLEYLSHMKTNSTSCLLAGAQQGLIKLSCFNALLSGIAAHLFYQR